MFRQRALAEGLNSVFVGRGVVLGQHLDTGSTAERLSERDRVKLGLVIMNHNLRGLESAIQVVDGSL